MKCEVYLAQNDYLCSTSLRFTIHEGRKTDDRADHGGVSQSAIAEHQ